MASTHRYVFSFEVRNERYFFEFTTKGWRVNGLEYAKDTDDLFSKYCFSQELNEKIKKTFSYLWDKLQTGDSESAVAQQALELENEIK